jgi:hypothetical protein
MTMIERFRRTAIQAYRTIALSGLDPRQALLSARGLPTYVSNYLAFRRQLRNASIPFGDGILYPCLSDRYKESGSARGHYFHQDLHVAKRVYERRPQLHADVGSRVDGFVAHVAAFREVHVFDIRPLANRIPNIVFHQLDLLQEIPAPWREFCDSLSCLHALEHFGLGRYGDPVDIEGHLKGLAGLVAMLKPGGTLYLSVPIGPARIEFDAHRVFSVGHVLEMTRERLELVSLSYVDDADDLHVDVAMEPAAVAESFGCQYGCGIFELRKR